MQTCIFIILGATGDLTKRKLIPAIYKLIEDNKIDRLAIIGTATTKTTINHILNQAKKFIPKVNNEIWKKIESVSYYCPPLMVMQN